MNENEDYDFWYHGGNSKIESFDIKPTINRRGNVEGFYFTKFLDKAQEYGDIITTATLQVKNPIFNSEDITIYDTTFN